MAPHSSAPEDRDVHVPSRAADPRLVLPQVDGRHEALDGIRAVAALMVLVFHVASETGEALAPGVYGGLLASLDLAVPLFFALSGVLLYRPWARAALDGVRGPRARPYLWRRAARVLPAYWVVAVAALLVYAEDEIDSPRHWWEVLTLTFPFNTDPSWFGTGPYGLGQMWSLSVEVSFYLLLPLFGLLLALWARRGRSVDARGARLLAGLAVMAVLGLAALVPQFHPEPHAYMHTWLPRTMGLFAAGMALAVLSEWAWREPGADGPVRRFCRTVAASPGVCWLLAGGFFVLNATDAAGSRFIGSGDIWTSAVHSLTGIGFAFFLVAPAALAPRPASAPVPLRRAAAWRDGRWMEALLRHRVCQFLARISYGVFLWQFMVLYLWRDFTGQEIYTGSFWLDAVPVTAGTILFAMATHRWVEEPSRRWSHRFFQRGAGAPKV
ncbi:MULTISPECIES: acyltransferase family protein [Nocardiopsis]|uniref:Acyltransferase n=1 Tax=Nocardiopsis sinuspersici TaxID=501010 RepID=A0A1V3BW83_9ACTN|nr:MULTISPECIES: acyltransferase [Nocardiopsis]OOC52653.1 acyltransferase [Nocardiopsis sinuspersici]